MARERGRSGGYHFGLRNGVNNKSQTTKSSKLAMVFRTCVGIFGYCSSTECLMLHEPVTKSKRVPGLHFGYEVEA
jgi:hypothetical protein